MRPRLPAMLGAPGGLGLRFALIRYRRFLGLRTFLAVSSVASGRIEFVSQPAIGPQFYGLSIHFQLLSTSCRHDAVTFSYWREAPPERDFHPPVHVHFQAHRTLPYGRGSVEMWFPSAIFGSVLIRRCAPVQRRFHIEIVKEAFACFHAMI